MKKLSALALSALMVLGATSCRHKELYIVEEPTATMTRIQVVFDWRDTPEASPESMAMYLYDDADSNPLRYIFSNSKGGEIRAPFGAHSAICLNADNTDWARLFNSESTNTFEVRTPDAAEIAAAQGFDTRSMPRVSGTESERLASTPGILYGAPKEQFMLANHGGTDTIRLYPHELVCHYTVDIYDVENLDRVKSATLDATLSGMAEGVNISRGVGTDVPATLTCTLKATAAESRLHGEFLTFGECETLSKRHSLTVYSVMANGEKWSHTFDVTDQVSQAPDPRHVHIVLHGLSLPQPGPQGGDSGMTVNVNGWQTVNIDLKM